MIIPATAPIGTNSYLFAAPGANATYAQYLNQSSVLNDGYNVLFTAFDLTMTYDGLPAGVKSSQLVLVDLVSVKVVNASKFDVSKNSVSAAGVTGNLGVWGGGGIYAAGFEGAVCNTTVSNTTFPYTTASNTTASNTTPSNTAPSNTTFVGFGEPASRLNFLNFIFMAGLMALGALIL